MGATRVLVVDDDKNTRNAIKMALSLDEYEVDLAADVPQALRLVQEKIFDLGIIDIRLGEVSGLELFRRLRDLGREFPVIMISGEASLAEAAQSIKLGAYDFLEKPFNAEKLQTTVARAMDDFSIRKKLQSLLDEKEKLAIIGDSPVINKIKNDVKHFASTDVTVLIQGESGTGKEVVARSIHDLSHRCQQPFVKVNCAAIPENLFESELFGFEKGAFTGAIQNKKGYFEQAHHGTLFLDEIGELSLSSQAKLLRVLQNQEIQKLGSEKIFKVDTRIISATNRDLKEMVGMKTFREDLFYRLNVVKIDVPSLRKRREDIPLLANYFLQTLSWKHGLKDRSLSAEVIEALKNYFWPGNIRELSNMIERLLIVCSGVIELTHLPDDFFLQNLMVTEGQNLSAMEQVSGFDISALTAMSLKDFREKTEREFIVQSLKNFNGNISETARRLNIERTFLHKKMHQYKIEKREYLI